MARDRTIHNDVVSDVASAQRVRRGEVLVGVERRRRWPDETRIAIVAEALQPGTVVSHVARRHDLNPSQLFGWLKQYRTEAMALRAAAPAGSSPAFVPAVVDLSASVDTDATAAVPAHTTMSDHATIEITVGGAVVRIRGAVDSRTLAVLKALKVLA